jgi:transmembrane sensor
VDSIALPDGSSAVLGPLSRLALAAAYGDAARELVLTGQAWFEVQHDAARPFRVRAGGALIEDLGTAFSVASDDGEVRVAVSSGSVLLQDTSLSRRGRGATLRAGDRATHGADGRITVERGAGADAELEWTRGRLVFDNATLSRVRTELRRWYGLDLRVDPTLVERHLTASFAGEPVDQVLRTIGLALGASIERRGDTAFVRAR